MGWHKAWCVEQIWALYLFNYWSSTKRLRGEEVFFGGQAETEAAIRGAQSHLSSLVSLLGIRLCSPYSLLIRGLIRLSPRMFLSYLSTTNFPQAKCSNWAILFHFKLKRGPIMRDFSFIAPTAGTLSLSFCPHSEERPCEDVLFSLQACQLQSATPGCEGPAEVWGLTGQPCR